MSATDNYFHFPLCLLAMGRNEIERINSLIPFAVVEAGNKMLEKRINNRQDMSTLGADYEEKWAEDEYDPDDEDHIAVALGADVLGVNLGSLRLASPREALETWQVVCKFRNQFEAKHGGSPEVRIKAEYVWEVRSKKGMSYRELAILCAMLSVTGDKEYPVRITREQIQRRMLGYKTAVVMQAELKNRTDGSKPLTVRQIGYTVDKLKERKFFARVRANKRQTYFSFRLTQEQMEDAIFKSKTRKQISKANSKKRDDAFMARLKAAMVAAKRSTQA